MAECATCSQQLRPEWKFCIRCGTPIRPPAWAPTLAVTPPARVEPPPPTRSFSRSSPTLAPPPPVTRVNTLAVLALILGCLASPLAALFGHVALAQITGTRERGRTISIVAIVLGYLALALIVGLVITYLVSHA